MASNEYCLVQLFFQDTESHDNMRSSFFFCGRRTKTYYKHQIALEKYFEIMEELFQLVSLGKIPITVVKYSSKFW